MWSLFQFHNETINVWTHFIGFWATLVGILLIAFNYTEVAIETEKV